MTTFMENKQQEIHRESQEEEQECGSKRFQIFLLLYVVLIAPGFIAKGQYTHDNGDGDEDQRQAQ
jgi:hypothetical protein